MLRVKALAFLVVVMTMLPAAAGQQDRGSITGTVSDPSGAAAEGIQVSIIAMATNSARETITNRNGQFLEPSLPIGMYRIVFHGPAYRTIEREPITLSAAQVVRVDARMQLGIVMESMVVRSEAPQLQTDTPDVGTVFGPDMLRELPLNFASGRLGEDFAYQLTPGVSGNNWESRINGSAAFSKGIVLDGADATVYIGGQFAESSPSLEAIQEMKIQTSGMSAEYGRTGGGVFNYVLKSGMNQLHGSALGFVHNEWADANSFSNNYFGNPRARDRRHNWGGSLGGPVVIPGIYRGSGRTYFYTAYERYKETAAGSGSPTVTVPLDEFWNGDLGRLLTGPAMGQDALDRSVLRGAIYDPRSTRFENGLAVRDAFVGNLIPISMVSEPARKLGTIFKEHYSPSVFDSDGRVALLNNSFFPVSNQAEFRQNQLSIKIDHSVSSAHKLNGSFVYVDRPRTLLDQGGVWDFRDSNGGPLSRARLHWVRSWYGRAAYDWSISANTLNHLQLGFNRQRNPSLSAHLGENGVNALGLRGFAKDYNFPEINFGNDNYLANYPTLGYQTNDFGAGQNFQVIDTVSWLKNRHAIRAGVDWRRSYLRWRADNGPAQIDFGPAQTGLPGFTQTGNGFASMLLGDTATASVPVATPTGSRFLNFAIFIQDDFRVTNRLTLNLGMRWDYQPLPVEQYNRLANWNPALVDPLWGFSGALEFASAKRRTFAPNHYRDFSPRFGFAYQLSPEAAIRGAYGIFYLARNGNGWSGVPWGQTAGFGSENRVSAPSEYGSAWNWSESYPGVVRNLPQNASLASGSPGVWGIVSYDPNAGKNGYSQQWNLNIQRTLAFDMVLEVGYVGSKSTGIQANELRRLNQLDPQYLALGDALGEGVTNQAELPATVAAAGGRYPFGSAGIWVPAYQTLLPYPHMMAWNEIKSAFSPLGFSTYHALQAQLNKRFSNGLSFLSNYTFSKAIDNVRSAFGDTWGANAGRPQDFYNRALDKSVSDADRTHAFKFAVQYELMPQSKPLRWAQGFTIQFVGNYISGWPLGIDGSWTPNSNFGASRGYMLDASDKPLRTNWDPSRIDMSQISEPNPAHRYINTALFVDPASIGRYQRGNTPYRLSGLRGPWQLSENISVQKNFRIKEFVRFQIRADLLNAFNRTLWGNIDANTASPLFGQVTGASNWFAPRKIQFGVRADW